MRDARRANFELAIAFDTMVGSRHLRLVFGELKLRMSASNE
jgi:hypothetical protein